jgi:hypothetical protein
MTGPSPSPMSLRAREKSESNLQLESSSVEQFSDVLSSDHEVSLIFHYSLLDA